VENHSLIIVNKLKEQMKKKKITSLPPLFLLLTSQYE